STAACWRPDNCRFRSPAPRVRLFAGAKPKKSASRTRPTITAKTEAACSSRALCADQFMASDAIRWAQTQSDVPLTSISAYGHHKETFCRRNESSPNIQAQTLPTCDAEPRGPPLPSALALLAIDAKY